MATVSGQIRVTSEDVDRAFALLTVVASADATGDIPSWGMETIAAILRDDPNPAEAAARLLLATAAVAERYARALGDVRGCDSLEIIRRSALA